MPTRSVALLQEGLEEISRLVAEAKIKNPVLYENATYSAVDIVLLEAESDKEGFLDRTTKAIEKVTKAGEAGIKELDALQQSLAAAGMKNSEEAVANARQALEKAIPGKSFMGSLTALGGGMVNALFGKEDDPVEKITEIVADVARYKQMLTNIVKLVTELLDDIKPEEAVDAAEGESGAQLDPEAEKAWIENFKNTITSGTIEQILTSEEDPYPEVRDAFSWFNEGEIEKAIKSSVKPASWFAGLKKVGGALGIGLGGDLPFKKFGLKLDGLLEDIKQVKISELQKIANVAAPDGDDKKMVDDTTSAVGDMGDLKDELPAIQQQSTDDQTAPGESAPVGDQSSAPDGDETSGEDQVDDSPYLKIVKAVPGVREPEDAADKLAQLLAAGFVYEPALGLRNLLAEKVLRYEDVVAALGDHLPEDENEIPAAVKKLSDEMKVELGAEFDIVGTPNLTAQELAALRVEVEALRKLFKDLPAEDIEAARDSVRGAFEDDGVPADVIDDLLDPDMPIDDVIDEIPSENVEDVQDAIPADPADLISGEEAGPLVGGFYEYEVRTGKNKGMKFGVKVTEVKPEENTVILARPNKAGTKFTKNVFAVKIDYLGEKLADESEALALVAKANEKNEALKFSRKEYLARVAVAKMRGYILQETNNFRYASNLTQRQVIKEFYDRGGRNKDISNYRKDISLKTRWAKIAGLKDE